MTWSGGCLCGKVRYEASEAPEWIVHCHCQLCRRQTGAAFATFVLYRDGNLTWLHDKPAVYRSTPGVERGFCPTCGSAISFARPGRGETSVLVGSLDDPNAVHPSEHIFVEQRCTWLHMDDGLPVHDRFPPSDEDREPDRGVGAQTVSRP